MDRNYFAVFSQEGNLPSFKQSQNINSSGLQTESPDKRIILIDSHAHGHYGCQDLKI